MPEVAKPTTVMPIAMNAQQLGRWLQQEAQRQGAFPASRWAELLQDWLDQGSPLEGLAWTAVRQSLAESGLQLRVFAQGIAADAWHEGFWFWAASGGQWSARRVDAAGQPHDPLSAAASDMAHEALPGPVYLIQSVGLPHQRGGQRSYWQWVAQILQGRLQGLVLSSMLINLGVISMPLFSMLVYDKVMHNGIFETLWALAIGVFLSLALEVMLRWLRARQVERLAQVLDQRVDAVLFQSLLQPSGRAGSQPGMTARFVSLYRDLYSARDFFSAHYLLALADVPFIFILWAVIGWIAWPLLLMLMAWTAVYVGLGTWVKNRSKHIGRHAAQLQTGKFALLADALSSLDALRTSHVGQRFQGRFATLSQDHADFQALQRHELTRQMLLSQAVYIGCSVSLLVLGAYLVFDQYITQGAMVAVGMLAGRTLAAVGQALMTLGRWRELTDALAALDPFLHSPSLDAAPVMEAPARAVEGDIKLLQVGHGYGGQAQALKDITLHIRAGERIALLGRPGSGKSTLARVLARAIEPTAGEVRVDDVALAAYPLNSRASWLSFKPQEATLVAGTVESNILAGLPLSASAEQRIQALKRGLYLSGMDVDLGNGSLSLSQAVEEYGSNLSGGQRQKVALARALAIDAKVLILDEPTNGLDPESEKLLVQRLAQLKGTTLILVTHSARALALCPRVVALDRGCVVADGATRELVKVDPVPGA
ncbi:hypothetical protein B9Z51_15270 [Limnohabitans sp. T6-5]|uniref:peptidase domain-containing ABC transporter n=1 Tax=Limnohabitans sp. T6-5 TaxID=1100724 RepID=UPI000D389581|nr:ATP-binding cassette domain-containing protein [Limnohabitans sp. T6-5]PUE07213.1 hypothetical protein B9Z51_15270 [Limnohabitans sp. T6-5]